MATEICSLESGYRVIITYLDVQNPEEVLTPLGVIASGGRAFTELALVHSPRLIKEISANEDIRVVEETGPRYDEEDTDDG